MAELTNLDLGNQGLNNPASNPNPTSLLSAASMGNAPTQAPMPIVVPESGQTTNPVVPQTPFTNSSPDRRGLLDIQIKLSNPNPTAGSEFTVYLEITNSFDVPIWPESPQVFLPSELQPISHGKQLGDSVQSVNVLLAQAAAGQTPPRRDLEEPPKGWRRWLPTLLPPPKSESPAAASIKYLAETARQLDQELAKTEDCRLRIKAEIDRAIQNKSATEKITLISTDPKLKELTGDLSESFTQSEALRQRIGRLTDQLVLLTGSSVIITDGDLKLANFNVRDQLYVRAKGCVTLDSPAEARIQALDSSLRPTDALQPGNTAIYSMALTTKSWLFFRPIQYQLMYSLNYSFDALHTRTNTNSASQVLTIRSPILAMMIGALIGGIAGWFAHRYTPTKAASPASWSDEWPQLILSMILGPIAIVFLARKSDAPAMITVEDFWGGVVVGFLIGYTGSAAFQQFVPGATAPMSPDHSVGG